MKAIDVNIYLDDGVLTIDSPSAITKKRKGEIGTEWDHQEQIFRFTRPVEFRDYDLMLLFKDGKDPEWKEKNIGSDDEYIITNALTQNNVLYLRLYFFKGNEYRRGANTLQFKFRSSTQGGSTLEVFSTAQIGDVTTTTLPPGSDATAAVDYTDSKLNFAFGIPRGRDGSGGGGGSYEIGDGLKLVTGQSGNLDKLVVDTADKAEEDNTKPITSAAVYTEVGNIEALLQTI